MHDIRRYANELMVGDLLWVPDVGRCMVTCVSQSNNMGCTLVGIHHLSLDESHILYCSESWDVVVLQEAAVQPA